jgi:hypothetical protein
VKRPSNLSLETGEFLAADLKMSVDIDGNELFKLWMKLCIKFVVISYSRIGSGKAAAISPNDKNSSPLTKKRLSFATA